VESLVRTLAEHLASWGGRPLLCVFDRPKTIALQWRNNGEVTEWNPVFAYATLEMGVGVELCWPYRAQQKGSGRLRRLLYDLWMIRVFLDETGSFRPCAVGQHDLATVFGLIVPEIHSDALQKDFATFVAKLPPKPS
jgi:hypothetical protein